MLHPVSALAISTMPRLGDADRVCFANRSIPALRYKPKHSQQKKQKICTPSRQRTHSIHARLALSAGVQTMRARICSAFSCDMFARVVV